MNFLAKGNISGANIQQDTLKGIKFAGFIVVLIVCAGIAGASIEYYLDQSRPVIGGGMSTLFQTVTESSIFTHVETVTRVSTIATFPANVEIEGSVYSEVYPSLYVSFIHCLPVAYVACSTFTSKVKNTENFTQSFGSLNYSYYLGTYQVVVPNNQTYGVAVGLASDLSNGSSLTALSAIPLYALSPVIWGYNIDCFFPNTNHSLSSISCMSE